MLVDMHKIELNGTGFNQNIVLAQDYLVKHSGKWHIGKFSPNIHGLSCWIGSHSIQLKYIDEVYDFQEPRSVKPGIYCMHVEV